jgi:predicted DNA-binding transcriptional regulator AlpA
MGAHPDWIGVNPLSRLTQVLWNGKPLAGLSVMKRHGLQALTARERQELVDTARHTRDVRVYRRATAILRIEEVEHPLAVAEMLGVSQMSVYRRIARYNEERRPTALEDRPRSAPPPVMAPISDGEFDTLVMTSLLSLGDMARGADGRR